MFLFLLSFVFHVSHFNWFWSLIDEWISEFSYIIEFSRFFSSVPFVPFQNYSTFLLRSKKTQLLWFFFFFTFKRAPIYYFRNSYNATTIGWLVIAITTDATIKIDWHLQGIIEKEIGKLYHIVQNIDIVWFWYSTRNLTGWSHTRDQPKEISFHFHLLYTP